MELNDLLSFQIRNSIHIWTAKTLEVAAADHDEPKTPPHPPPKKHKSGKDRPFSERMNIMAS
mgnify:CR=1 FL=1